jgi:hypothetical protein
MAERGDQPEDGGTSPPPPDARADRREMAERGDQPEDGGISPPPPDAMRDRREMAERGDQPEDGGTSLPLCIDDIFVSAIVPSHPRRTDLYNMIPERPALFLVSSTPVVGYDALGYSHLDGFLYGIDNFRHEGAPGLVRISTAGVVTELGALPALAGQEWTLGTILRDGTYLVGAHDSKAFLRITLPEGPIAAGTSTFSDVTCWAAHPTDGMVYGYRFERPGLVKVDPMTGAMTHLGPLKDVGQRPCSCTFDKAGTLLLLCGDIDHPDCPHPDGDFETLWMVDVEALTATFVGRTDPLGATDMASCPFTASAP